MTALYLGIFVLSLVLSFILTRIVRNTAVARGVVSVPVLDRHLHQAPLPRLGGVAIFVAFVLSLGVALVVAAVRPDLQFGSSLRTLTTILVPGFFIFLLGLYDDLRTVSPYSKFTIQAIAATMLWLGGLRILDLPVLFGARHFPWFVGLSLDEKVFDASTFSKNRHGRFRDSDLLRRMFEVTVERCLAEGLVGGEGFAVDASLIRADANRQPGHTELPTDAPSRAVREYLEVLDDAAFGSATPTAPKVVSPVDPAARWTAAQNGQAQFCYATNYLIDVEHGVIVDVEAPAGETVALFAEGPTPEWALPVPAPVAGAPAGLQRLAFELDGAPSGQGYDGIALTLTARAGAACRP